VERVDLNESTISAKSAINGPNDTKTSEIVSNLTKVHRKQPKNGKEGGLPYPERSADGPALKGIHKMALKCLSEEFGRAAQLLTLL
jgi:hypothetical protein